MFVIHLAGAAILVLFIATLGSAVRAACFVASARNVHWAQHVTPRAVRASGSTIGPRHRTSPPRDAGTKVSKVQADPRPVQPQVSGVRTIAFGPKRAALGAIAPTLRVCSAQRPAAVGGLRTEERE
ncbi:MAG TPA: hypothetical protein VGK30_19180 [Candidatus Binatia bacterium]|jgi:hypothetical protein